MEAPLARVATARWPYSCRRRPLWATCMKAACTTRRSSTPHMNLGPPFFQGPFFRIKGKYGTGIGTAEL